MFSRLFKLMAWISSEYRSSKSVKKKNLNNYLNSQKGYRIRKNISILFKVFASIILIASIIFTAETMSGEPDMDLMIGAIFGFGAAGFIFAFIPFIIGDAIKRKAAKEYSYPFDHILSEELKLYPDGIEYSYVNTSNKNWPNNLDVYRIPKENITAVNYDKKLHILTIIGEAELLAYDDYPSKRLNYEKSQRRFYSDTPYQILLTFNDENDVIKTMGWITERIAYANES